MKATGSTAQPRAVQCLDATEADDLAKLDADLARNPNDVRIRDGIDSQQSMMVAMFRRRHGQAIRELAMRQSSTIVPPEQPFTPTVQSPLRIIVLAGPHESEIDASGATVGGEHSDGGPVLADPMSGTNCTHDVQYDIATAIDETRCKDVISSIQGEALNVTAGTYNYSGVLMLLVLTILCRSSSAHYTQAMCKPKACDQQSAVSWQSAAGS